MTLAIGNKIFGLSGIAFFFFSENLQYSLFYFLIDFFLFLGGGGRSPFSLPILVAMLGQKLTKNLLKIRTSKFFFFWEKTVQVEPHRIFWITQRTNKSFFWQPVDINILIHYVHKYKPKYFCVPTPNRLTCICTCVRYIFYWFLLG